MEGITLTAENFKHTGFHFDLSDNVFDKNKNLITNFTVPDTITIKGTEYEIHYLDEYLFTENETLEEITLPRFLKGIDNHVFSYCENLKKVNVNENLQQIGEFAFEGCALLESFTCPKNLRSIGACAFEYSGLKKIKLNDDLIINAGAFRHTNIFEITLPKNLKFLYYGTFSYCPDLTKITLNENLEYIHSDTFEYTKTIKELILPDSFKLTEEDVDTFLDDLKNTKTVVYLPANISKDVKDGLLKRTDVIFKTKSLEYLIEKGKSFKEINKHFKTNEER